MIFECWEGDHELSFFPEDTQQRELHTHDNDGKPLVHVYSIRANSWTEAMTAHHEAQGWGPYKPMEDAS